MNGATWTAAKSKPGLWARLRSELWSRFGKRGQQPPKTRESCKVGAILLVGAFANLRALHAARGKLARALQESEFFCIPDAQGRPVGGVFSGLSGPLSRVLGCDWTEKQMVPIEAPEAVRDCMRRVLLSGGGFVLVRAVDRFPEACEIINAAGGRVGFPDGIADDASLTP